VVGAAGLGCCVCSSLCQLSLHTLTLPGCGGVPCPGGDASEGFHGPQHPPTVHELVKDYCIGTLTDP
jgi:hypothetical protein